MKKSLEEIAKEEGKYGAGAYAFVYEGLAYTVKHITHEPRHVSGQVLCEGLRRMAIEKYGRLAKLVLNTWGLKTTHDFGQIVYSLIEHEWMSAQASDSIDDFNGVYEFQTVFKDQFAF
jgi:uncharacterized repeat protein (TIGR04138 family)